MNHSSRRPKRGDFSADDFLRAAIADVAASGKLPMVAGSFVEALVDDPAGEFRSKHKMCFLWVDADIDVLQSFVAHLVDEMVEGGVVEEVRAFCPPAQAARSTCAGPSACWRWI